MKTLMITLSLILMVAGCGMTAISSLITPAEVDQNALRYVADAGVAELDDYNAWYPNLAEATRLKKDVDSAHSTIQLSLVQQIQKDDLDYSIHQGVVANNLTIAEQREESLFGEAGLLPLGLSMLGAGGFAGLLGLMRKRPGDVTAPEMEQALATVKGQTAAELSVKERQFVQLVKGVQAFMDIHGSDGTALTRELKTIMNEYQDTDTRAAVAVVKAV